MFEALTRPTQPQEYQYRATTSFTAQRSARKQYMSGLFYEKNVTVNSAGATSPNAAPVGTINTARDIYRTNGYFARYHGNQPCHGLCLPMDEINLRQTWRL